MMKKRIFSLILLAGTFLPVLAQNETSLWVGAEADKKLSKDWNISLETEYRLRDNLSTTDRWSLGIGAEYRIAKWLKADAGYDFLYNYNPKETTTTLSEKGKKYITKETESYWTPRHRFHVSFTGTLGTGNWKFSLRERWQYTYRPEQTVSRVKTKTVISDGETEEITEDKVIGGKGLNQLRSRFQVKYKIPSMALTPFAYAEMFNSDRIDKMRYSVGATYDFSKRASLKFFYLYQDKSDEDEVDGHVIGLNFGLSF